MSTRWRVVPASLATFLVSQIGSGVGSGIGVGLGVGAGVPAGVGVGVAVGIGVGVGGGAWQKRSLLTRNASSRTVSLTLEATTKTFPTVRIVLKTAHRDEAVLVVLLSSRVPRLARNVSFRLL